MEKTEHIKYWITSSNDDWDSVTALFKSERFIHCLFFAHLSLEKLCKAPWVRDHEENIPPKIHNLVKLLKESQIELVDNDLIFLQEFNDFQLEGRYPDYLFRIKKICTMDYTAELISKVEGIRKCLLKKLH